MSKAHDEFTQAARFHCKACDFTMAVTTSASPAEKQRFDLFCNEHSKHEAERLVFEKARRVMVSK